MLLNHAEFIRSLCPDFRWLNRNNKTEIKQTYTAELEEVRKQIISLNQYKIKVNQTITNFNQYWFLELAHEEADKKIEEQQKQAKRYGWIISTLSVRRNSRQGTKTSRITDADIARAKEVPIETLYQGPLRRSAGRLTGLCKIHQEKSPSFTIYEKQNTFWCFGCSEGGSSIDFIMKTQNLKFLEAVKFLLQK